MLLNLTSSFAQESDSFQQYIDNSKTVKSYHTEIYYRDLLDEKTKDKNYNTIDWKIDFVSPDRVSVRQSAWTDNSGDVWITIGKKVFRFFGAWIETTNESENTTFDLHSFLLLDKYLDLLRGTDSVAQSHDGNFIVLSYIPEDWGSFNKIWKLNRGYKADVKIWIDPKDNLIKKAYSRIQGKDFEGAEHNFEMTQLFTNYNDVINIKEPETANIKDRSEYISVNIISRPQAKKNAIIPQRTKGARHMAIVSNILPHGIWEMGPDPNGKIITTNTVQDLPSWHTHMVTQKCIDLGGDYINSESMEIKKQGLIDAIAMYEKHWVGQKYDFSSYNENYAIESVIYAAGGNLDSAKTKKGKDAR